MESQILMAFRHIAANDSSFALKVLVDFGKCVKDITEQDLIENLGSESIAALQQYADEMNRRNKQFTSRIRRKGGRP